MDQHLIAHRDTPAIGLVHFAFHLERGKIGNLRQNPAWHRMIADLERLRVVPSLRIIRQIIDDAIERTLKLHLFELIRP